GRPKAVVAKGARSASGSWDHVFTTLDYGDGLVAFAEGTFLVPSSFPFTMTFRAICENGTVEFMFRAGVNIEARQEAENPVTVYRKDGSLVHPEVSKPTFRRSGVSNSGSSRQCCHVESSASCL
ncbi:MAG: hypothetical protein AB1774_12230, partial [Bacillota bacterium]